MNLSLHIHDQSYPLASKSIQTDVSKKAWLTAGITQSIKTKTNFIKNISKDPPLTEIRTGLIKIDSQK